MTAVAGAWSNRVYRLETGRGAFAVKALCNPWADDRWHEWLAEAWSFELRAIAAGVPAPEPIPSVADGSCLAWVAATGGGERVPVRVHRWVDGVPAPDRPVENAVSDWAGRVLARLHALGIWPADRSVFPVATTETADRWPALCEAARRAAAPWVDRLDAVRAAVEAAAELARDAERTPDRTVMSHGDIDQKNLILTAGGPVLCDWDVAMPLVPRRELADVALSLGGWARVEVSRRVIRAYVDAGGEEIRIAPHDLGPSLMAGLDWVAFNVERAIGQRPASPEQAELARRIVPGLLAELPRRTELALRAGEVLVP
jgi:aminoglycoside phosphotransferase (APT) family kinase protein